MAVYTIVDMVERVNYTPAPQLSVSPLPFINTKDGSSIIGTTYSSWEEAYSAAIAASANIGQIAIDLSGFPLADPDDPPGDGWFRNINAVEPEYVWSGDFNFYYANYGVTEESALIDTQTLLTSARPSNYVGLVWDALQPYAGEDVIAPVVAILPSYGIFLAFGNTAAPNYTANDLTPVFAHYVSGATYTEFVQGPNIWSYAPIILKTSGPTIPTTGYLTDEGEQEVTPTIEEEAVIPDPPPEEVPEEETEIGEEPYVQTVVYPNTRLVGPQLALQLWRGPVTRVINENMMLLKDLLQLYADKDGTDPITGNLDLNGFSLRNLKPYEDEDEILVTTS